MNNCPQNDDVYQNALAKIKADKPCRNFLSYIGPTGPTGPTGPAGGPTGPTGATETYKSVSN